MRCRSDEGNFAPDDMFCAKLSRMKKIDWPALLTVIAGVVIGGLILRQLFRFLDKIAWENRPRIGFQV
jgi:hypothetical protein